jgi:hypothetical protein
MRTAIIATVLLLTASVANAQEAHVGMGFGTLTCGEFAQHYRQSVEFENYYFTWAQGYMTAMNIGISIQKHQFRDLASRPVNDEKTSIRLYCNNHPLAEYLSAIMDLYNSLPIKDSP